MIGHRTKILLSAIFLHFLMTFIFIIFCVSAWAANIYYDVSTTAYPTIQSAIDAALAASTPVGDTEVIRVAQGTYIENLTINPSTTGNFTLTIEGGWDSTFTSRTLNPANTTIDGNKSARVFFVLSSFGEILDLTIEGFTITNGAEFLGGPGGGMYVNVASSSRVTITQNTITGNTINGDHSRGCGINAYANSPDSTITIINNTFNSNIANGNSTFGGGIYILGSGAIAVIGNTILSNSAKMGGGIAALPLSDSPMTIANNTITQNIGGGINAQASRANAMISIRNNIIVNNSEAGSGGGIYALSYSDNTKVVITNNLVAGNTAGSGGGILASATSSGVVILTNNTVTANIAQQSIGGGVYSNVWSGSFAIVNLINNIIRGNTAYGNGQDVCVGTNISQTTIDYCDFGDIYPATGWGGGTGNINADPLFVTGLLGNYYLSHITAGQAEDSPCIDSGSDTAENLELNNRTTRTDQVPDSGIVDMGYHYPICCEGDFDDDGDVDGSDLAVFAADFGRTDCTGSPYPCEGDFDDDGDVDGSDLAVFAADFGRTDCPGFLKIPYIKGYSNSGCLDMHYGVPEEYPGCGEDEVIAMVEGNSIFVTHMNTTYNCCPDDIEVTLS